MVRTVSRTIFVLLFLFVTIGTATARQLQVVASKPQPYAVTGEFNAPIEISFSAPVLASNIRSVTVYGSYHGFYDIADIAQRSPETIAITPRPVLIQGERITVTIQNDFVSQNGTALQLPYQFSFRVQNQAGLFRPAILPSDTVIQNIDLISGEQQPVKIAVANFDADPYLEAVLVSSASSTVTIFDNDGSQILLESAGVVRDPINPVRFERTPLDVAVADFDSSGTMDIIVPFSSNRIYILWGNGDATFVPQPIFDLQLRSNEIGEQPNAITVNDFNADGLPDFSISSVGANTIMLYHNMLRDSGRGFFQEQVRPAAKTETGIFGITSADFNLDGRPDVAAIYNGTNSVSVFVNRSGAGFGEKTPVSIPLRPVAIHAANLIESSDNTANRDFPELAVLSAPFAIIGKPSAATAQQSQLTILRWLPDGEGRYVIAQEIALDNIVQSFALASLDGRFNVPLSSQDHDLDFLTGDFENGSLGLLANVGNGFSAPAIVDRLPAPRTIAVADFNRDGIDDVLYASHNQQQLRLIRSTGLPDTTIVCDFGDVFVGQRHDTTKQISLQNSFDVQVTLQWNDRANFNVQPTSASLRGGELLPLALSFTPQDTGLFVEAVSVQVAPNTSGRDAATILLTGRGVLVDFAIEPDSCFFPVTPPDSVAACSLKVVNNGNGFLQLGSFAIRNKTPAFRVRNRQPAVLVSPYDSAFVVVEFAPADTGSFADELLITSNDADRPMVSIPLLARSTRNRPIYCAASPDTIEIVEHQPFCFVATQGVCATAADSLNGCIAGVFEDPDGERLTFRFRQLPGWIRSTTVDAQGNVTIRGAPSEGAQDTTFRVIAEKAFVSTEKEIFLKIISVNDAPVFLNLPDSIAISENQQLTFQVQVSDPEGADVSVVALNLENLCGNNATFDPQTRTLRWQPQFGCAGEYLLDFQATELTADSLSSLGRLTIRVDGALPDLVMDGISLSLPEIRLNQTATITALFHNETAPIRPGQEFSARIFVNGQIVQTQRFTAGMDTTGVDSIVVSHTFDRTSQFTITAEVDFLDQIAEQNEDNNIATRELTVETGQLLVRPNPFTPNGDGKNDFVIFDLNQLALALPVDLTIFDMRGRRLRSLSSQGSQAQLFWDGRDSGDEEQLPGVYLYVLKDANNKSLQGYVVLAR